jgi:PPOX class probable F420-dependent enzyme
VTRLTNWLTDRARHRGAFEVTAAATVGFDHLRGCKYALLTTFRRSGEAVPTPIWFGLDDAGRAYVRSEAEVGKVKRIRRQPRVLLTPCTYRGRPVGPAAEGRARILPPEESDRAEAALRANYGSGRRVYDRAARATGVDLVYLEIGPAGRPGGA